MTRVLITRPSPEAERWVEQLRALHIDAEALPLLSITAVRDPQLQAALAQARTGLKNFHALMFVSGNAAAEFLAEGVDLSQPLPRFWSPGPGTARALVSAGVPAGLIDGPADDSGQFDSESLWLAVGTQMPRQARTHRARSQLSAGQGWQWTRLAFGADHGRWRRGRIRRGVRKKRLATRFERQRPCCACGVGRHTVVFQQFRSDSESDARNAANKLGQGLRAGHASAHRSRGPRGGVWARK